MDKGQQNRVCYRLHMTKASDNVGEVGEQLAARFLKSKGFSIEGQNFHRPWGEIDIIAVKDKQLVFVEVKTVSCTIPGGVPADGANMHRPEEKVNKSKRERLARIIQTHLEQNAKEEGEWRVDLICVYLDLEAEDSRVKWLKNIII